METIIRKATQSDIEGILPMWINLVEDHSDQHKLFKANPNFKEQLRKDIVVFLGKPNVTFFVAEFENELVGYAMTTISQRPQLFAHSKKGYISDTYVRDTIRRTGIGTKLVSTILSWFKEQHVDFVDLQVTISNEQGKKFWEKQGFKILNYYMVHDLSN